MQISYNNFPAEIWRAVFPLFPPIFLHGYPIILHKRTKKNVLATDGFLLQHANFARIENCIFLL